MSREQAPIDFPREGIQRKAAAAGRVNQSSEHEDREMAVTVKHCENCVFYYVGSVEKCAYCNRNLVTYRADGKWTKEYFDLDSKAKNGDRNAKGLRRGVVSRSNREQKKGEQERRHKEQLKSQENINETLKKLLETVENMDKQVNMFVDEFKHAIRNNNNTRQREREPSEPHQAAQRESGVSKRKRGC